MIISASRRTDIPAFYAEWFINRIRTGYCSVPNPFNRNQVSGISLLPADVKAIIFWTRNPRPLLPYLPELDQRGFRYYFQYTIMQNPRSIDPKSPPPDAAIKTFRELAERIGPARVIWRYDPIVFTSSTGVRFHQEAYARLADSLRGATTRSVISIMDVYKKAQKRLREAEAEGMKIEMRESAIQSAVAALVPFMVETARNSGMEIVSCAEDLDLGVYGVRPGKCIDDDLIERVLGIEVVKKKDPSQRKACGCVMSRDIGMYDSCLFGCRYCYATSSFERARLNHDTHDPKSPSLLGWYDARPANAVETVDRLELCESESRGLSCNPSNPEQLNLF